MLESFFVMYGVFVVPTDELKAQIRRDIDFTREELLKPELSSLREHPFFTHSGPNGDSKL